MNGVKLYFHYLSLHLRERMEYKNPCCSSFSGSSW